MAGVHKFTDNQGKIRYKYRYKKFNGVKKSVSARSLEDLKYRVVNELGYEWYPEYEEL